MRWTGQRSAISSRRWRCSGVRGPSTSISRSMRSIFPTLVSQLGAVDGVDLRVAEPHADPFQRQRLAVGVHPQRHRGAGAERAEEQVVGGRARGRSRRPPPARRPSGGGRGPRSPARSRAGAPVTSTSPSWPTSGSVVPVERTLQDSAPAQAASTSPAIAGVPLAAQQVVRRVERDEALGMLGQLEQPPGVLEADDRVHRRVEDQQRPMEPSEDTPQMILRQVVEQRAADAERASPEVDLGLAARLEVGGEPDELLLQLPVLLGAPIVETARASGIRAAAASTAQPPRLCPTSRRGASRSRRRKSAAATRSSTLEEKPVPAKSPSLSPDAGEVEPQHGDPPLDQGAADPAGGLQVLRAGEAVGEEGVGDGPAGPVGAVEARRQALAAGRRETAGARCS